MGPYDMISINSPKLSAQGITPCFAMGEHCASYTFIKVIAGQRSKKNLTMRDVVSKVAIYHQLTKCLIIKST